MLGEGRNITIRLTEIDCQRLMWWRRGSLADLWIERKLSRANMDHTTLLLLTVLVYRPGYLLWDCCWHHWGTTWWPDGLQTFSICHCLYQKGGVTGVWITSIPSIGEHIWGMNEAQKSLMALTSTLLKDIVTWM